MKLRALVSLMCFITANIIVLIRKSRFKHTENKGWVFMITEVILQNRLFRVSHLLQFKCIFVHFRPGSMFCSSGKQMSQVRTHGALWLYTAVLFFHFRFHGIFSGMIMVWLHGWLFLPVGWSATLDQTEILTRLLWHVEQTFVFPTGWIKLNLTFLLAHPWASYLRVKCLSNFWMDYHELWIKYSLRTHKWELN